MQSAVKSLPAGLVMLAIAAFAPQADGKKPATAPPPQGSRIQRIDLAERLTAGTLRAVNRDAKKIDDRPGAVYMSEREGNGILWVEGTDFGEGAIEIDVRGRDLLQRSFVGIAFHGDGDSYECVYLRPFNFRSQDPVRRQHAVQYIGYPEYDWPRLRKQFPEEFENPVDQSIVPTDWVPLRVVVRGEAIQIFVGPVKEPTLEVRKLGQRQRGMVGLWTGNTSDGAFANLRITTAK